MKILKTDKRLIDEGYRYKIEGDLISEGNINLTDLDKSLYVTGSIKAGRYIEAGKTIKAGGSIKAGLSIKAGRYIEAGLSIKAGGSIEAGLSIKAGGSIEAGGYIEAGEYIKAGEYYGITAGLCITAKNTITAGLKIFAGICTWRNVSDEEKTITCTELKGGAIVEHGILNLIGTPKEDEIIELNGKKYKLMESE